MVSRQREWDDNSGAQLPRGLLLRRATVKEARIFEQHMRTHQKLGGCFATAHPRRYQSVFTMLTLENINELFTAVLGDFLES